MISSVVAQTNRVRTAAIIHHLHWHFTFGAELAYRPVCDLRHPLGLWFQSKWRPRDQDAPGCLLRPNFAKDGLMNVKGSPYFALSAQTSLCNCCNPSVGFETIKFNQNDEKSSLFSKIDYKSTDGQKKMKKLSVIAHHLFFKMSNFQICITLIKRVINF